MARRIASSQPADSGFGGMVPLAILAGVLFFYGLLAAIGDPRPDAPDFWAQVRRKEIIGAICYGLSSVSLLASLYAGLVSLRRRRWIDLAVGILLDVLLVGYVLYLYVWM